jgi:hypothetical protein
MSGSTSPTGIATSPVTTCCEGGRPVATDPVTGQSVCSCQYDASRLTLSSYPRLNPYGPSPYAPQNDHNPPYPSLDSSAFYSPVSLVSDPKHNISIILNDLDLMREGKREGGRERIRGDKSFTIIVTKVNTRIRIGPIVRSL